MEAIHACSYYGHTRTDPSVKTLEQRKTTQFTESISIGVTRPDWSKNAQPNRLLFYCYTKQLGRLPCGENSSLTLFDMELDIFTARLNQQRLNGRAHRSTDSAEALADTGRGAHASLELLRCASFLFRLQDSNQCHPCTPFPIPCGELHR